MVKLTPEYYRKFKCIADQCSITCCQEWKISVDSNTFNNWKKLASPKPLGEEYKSLSSYTMKKDHQRVIRLDSNHKCPFLSDDKLCHLVCSYGDSVLSDTCQTFPRETHVFDDHTEQMLMPCCPAVIDLWKDESLIFPDYTSDFDSTSDHAHEDILFLIRAKIISMIQDSSTPFEITLLECFYILLELWKNEHVTTALIEEYFSDDTIKQLRHAIDDIDISRADTLNECNELLQDLSVNYQNEGLYENFLTPIIESAKTFECNLKIASDDSIESFLSEFSAYDTLIRNYLANECFSDLVLPDSDLESMLIQFQWLAIEYAAIRQSLLLDWLLTCKNNNCPHKLKYETVREHIVIISRMTGYESEDIEEYLDNSFESMIWDWGYFALVIGEM